MFNDFSEESSNNNRASMQSDRYYINHKSIRFVLCADNINYEPTVIVVVVL
jgi:hypothetical protein